MKKTSLFLLLYGWVGGIISVRKTKQLKGAVKMFYVIYDNEVSIWCYEEEAFEKLLMGWKFYAITDNEETADFLAEEACFIK